MTTPKVNKPAAPPVKAVHEVKAHNQDQRLPEVERTAKAERQRGR